MIKRKYRRHIVIALLLLFAVAVAVALIDGHKATDSIVAVVAPTPVVANQSIPAPVISPASGQRQMPGGPYQSTDPRWKERDKMLQEDRSYEWKTPISLFGKVIDQYGEPVVGVTVDVVWTDLSSKGSSERVLVTEADGRFSLMGERGKALVVHSLIKPGYKAANASNRYEFEFSAFWEPTYYVPDPGNPVIFHMWKEGESATLIHHGPTLFSVKNDGTSTNFNLTTGGKAGNVPGDIAVQITAGPSMNRRFDWTVNVQGIGGAELVQSTDEFMATAPTSGYTDQWTFNQQATDEQFQQRVEASFYVKTGSGEYGKVELRIIPKYQAAGAVQLSTYLNPTAGDTNLQYDPSKAINPQR